MQLELGSWPPCEQSLGLECWVPDASGASWTGDCRSPTPLQQISPQGNPQGGAPQLLLDETGPPGGLLCSELSVAPSHSGSPLSDPQSPHSLTLITSLTFSGFCHLLISLQPH